MSDSRRPESTITLLWKPQKSYRCLGSHNWPVCKQFFVSLPLTVCFVWQVMARRVEPDGRMRFLVHWFPEDMWVHRHSHFYVMCTLHWQRVGEPSCFFFSLPDEWVPESEAQNSRTIPVPSLSPAAMTSLQTALFVPRRNKQRRKPQKFTWWPDTH